DPLNIALAVMAVLLLVVGGPVLMRQLRGPEPLPGSVATLPVASGQEHRTLKVSGMMCANCVQTIGDALQATPGVVSADVDLEAGRADVLCEKALADTALLGAVARSGTDYSATVVSH
ncbi:MAG: heavy metal-associated domain-containing protein, partial [Candidatus Eisenbacteria bacterium]